MYTYECVCVYKHIVLNVFPNPTFSVSLPRQGPTPVIPQSSPPEGTRDFKVDSYPLSLEPLSLTPRVTQKRLGSRFLHSNKDRKDKPHEETVDFQK